MVRVPLREGRTLHHDVIGRYGAGHVVMRSAPPGTGIIAGGPMRAVFETLGVQDVVAKSIGTQNPHNMIKATFEALNNLQSPRAVASRRSKKVGDIIARRGEAAPDAAADTAEAKEE
jgi:small subunit ribosomal protein S5